MTTLDIALPEGLTAERLSTQHPFLLVHAEAGVPFDEWTRQHRDALRAILLRHGAVQIRGLDLNKQRFGAMGKILEPEAIDYTGGIGPRHLVEDDVFTSTDLPPAVGLASHNEMSYGSIWPMRVLFFCEEAPESGGATTVCDARRMFDCLPTEIRDEFLTRGIRYVRNYSKRVPYKTIQETFGTTDREQIDAFCKKNNIETQWLGDDALQLRQYGPAIRKHPETGDSVFFNTLALWHPAYWLDIMRRVYPGAPEPQTANDLWQDAQYGDGGEIPFTVVMHILAAYEEQEYDVSWQKGDVLYIDNMLASHGRKPFSGKRSILASFRQPLKASDIQAD
ncbi:TauD/TfdA family dioxygenase [Pseudomonas sp. dw_612]|uniref:TauD/TfdA family dioxygenase n=1 Tax=Pseudomonas sp. dw_612 TaxID=2720080 RepID=UPI001BD26CDC|nr:TauD/TfdA family dioxygenase [Pseudomonas sp. dw_612]